MRSTKVNKNTPGEWNKLWTGKKVRFFPKYPMNRIRGLIPEGSDVLEIGCGNGEFLSSLVKRDCNVYGVDISSVAIREAKLAGIPSEIANAENLDALDREADIVVCSHVLEHVTNEEGLARNIARLARKFAIIAVPNNVSGPDENEYHERLYTLGSLRKLLTPYFKLVEEHTLKNHLIVKCIK